MGHLGLLLLHDFAIADAIPDADGRFAGYGEEFADGNGGSDCAEVRVFVEQAAILGADAEVAVDAVVDAAAEEEGGAIAWVTAEGRSSGREDEHTTAGVGEWFEVAA